MKAVTCKGCGAAYLTAFNKPVEYCGGCRKKQNKESETVLEDKEAPSKTTITRSGKVADIGKLTFKAEHVSKSVFRPQLDPHFHVDEGVAEVIDAVEKLSHTAPQNLMLVGDQGCGKTELAVWIAAKYQRDCLIMNMSCLREPRDIFGFRTVQDGKLDFHISDYVRAVETGGHVIIKDEFNRTNPACHNSIFPLLDNRRFTFIDEINRTVKVGPGTIFVATCNIGAKHTGTFTMDSAMKERFGIQIPVSPLEEAIEAKVIYEKTPLTKAAATKLAKLGHLIRRNHVSMGGQLASSLSTRQLLNSAVLMATLDGHTDPVSALDFTIASFFDKEGGSDSERAQVLQLIQGVYGG